MLRRTYIIFILAILSTLQLTANTMDNKTISLPQGTVEGVLSNGFRYIIKSNSQPRHSVEMRLLVHAGSLQESDAQKGSAHFIEHIAFDGTEHYPDNAWTDFFERLGMKRGPDFGAFTDFDHTTYWLSLPVADMGYHVMNSTLLALRDILNCISFNAREVEKERRNIIDELHGYTPSDVFLPLKNGKGRHAHRPPLGKESDFRTLTREDIIKYYKKWYLPRNACLVVVGDVEAEDMKKRIQTIFGEVEAGTAAIVGKYPLNYKKGVTLYENRGKGSNSQLEFIIPHPHIVANNQASEVFKEQLDLLVSSLNKRMEDQAIQGVIINSQYEATDKDLFSIAVGGETKKILKKRMNRVLALLGKIAGNGFYKVETADRAAQWSQSLCVDTAGMTSAKWCDRFSEYVVLGERQVYDNTEMAYVKDKVRATDNSQMQNILNDILNKGKETLLVAYRNNAGATEIFNEKELHQIYQRGLSAHLSGYTYKRADATQENMTDIPLCLRATHADAMDKVNTVKVYDEIRAKEYLLDNGLKIILRPTSEKDSILHLALIGRGGTSDLDAQSYPLLQDAVNMVDMGGLAHVSNDSLLEAMHDANLTLNVRMGQYWHKLRASAPIKMAQVLMNLAYEKITAPGRAYEAFENVRGQIMQSFDNERLLTPLIQHDSDQIMLHRIDSLCCNTPATNRKMRKEDMDKFNLDDITDYYISLFSNPQRKALILTGNFQSDQILKTAVATFSRLRHSPSMGTITDTPSKMPQTPYQEFFANDSAKQLVLNYIFPGNYIPGLRQTVIMQLMRSILQGRIDKVLRDQLNISHDAFAAVSFKGEPQRNYYFWLTINTKDENRDKAIQAVKDIVTDLQTHAVDEVELKKLKMSFLVSRRRALTDDVPVEWENTFVNLIQNHETLEEINGFTHCLRSISAEDIRQGFNDYLRPERMALLSKGKPLQSKKTI